MKIIYQGNYTGHCPFCEYGDVQTKIWGEDSRTYVKRRRYCPDCQHNWEEIFRGHLDEVICVEVRQ